MATDLMEAKDQTKEKPEPVLYVKFAGDDVSLDSVSLSMLSRVLNAIGQLSSVAEHPVRPTPGGLPDPGAFQLIGAEAGSAIYAFGGRVSGIPRLRGVGQGIERPEEVKDVNFSLSAIDELSQVAARLHCEIQIYDRPNDPSSIITRIGPDTSRRLEKALYIKGATTIFGTLKRVGGVTKMSCSVRLPGRQKLLYCRVQGAELSRKLGRWLYQDVVLTGEATWVRSNWSIVQFVVLNIAQPKQGKLVKAFDEIREAGGNDWDEIEDPEAFLDHDRGYE